MSKTNTSKNKEKKQSIQGSTREPKQSIQGSTREPKQSIQGSTREPKQSIQGSTREPKQSIQGSMREPKQSIQGSTREPKQLVQQSMQESKQSIKDSLPNIYQEQMPDFTPLGSRQSFLASSHLIKARADEELYNIKPVNMRPSVVETISECDTSDTSEISVLEHRSIIDSSTLFPDVDMSEVNTVTDFSAEAILQLPRASSSSSTVDVTSNAKEWTSEFIKRRMREKEFEYMRTGEMKTRRNAVLSKVNEDDEDFDIYDSSTLVNLAVPAGKPVHFPSIGKPTDEHHQKPQKQQQQQQDLGRIKFKRMVAKVRRTAHVSRDAKNQKLKNAKEFAQDRMEQEPLLFCKEDFTRTNKTYSQLTKAARVILSKPPAERTEEELAKIYDVVAGLKCLSVYSRNIKRELARVMRYETYDTGRVIVKEGRKAEEFYLIVAGSVNMVYTERMRMGYVRQRIVGTLVEGQCFGELELLYEMKRNATYVVREPQSEFFSINKHDFQQVLHDCHERMMNEKLDILLREDTTKDWPYEHLTSLSSQCKLVEFGSDKIILGNTDGNDDVICQIVSGRCRLVRELYLVKIKHSMGKHSFRLATEKDMQRAREAKARRMGLGSNLSIVERHLWTIGVLGQGYYFGVGEDMTDTYLVTQTPVECLFMPRVHFHRANQTHHLDRLKEKITKYIPNNKRLFKAYFSALHWDRYKTKLVDEIVKKNKRRSGTRYEDVPLAIRREQFRSLTTDVGI